MDHREDQERNRRREKVQCRCLIIIFLRPIPLRHLVSVKLKPLSRAIKCCCRSFNAPLTVSCAFYWETILAMGSAEDNGSLKRRDSVKNRLFGIPYKLKDLQYWKVLMTSCATTSGCERTLWRSAKSLWKSK